MQILLDTEESQEVHRILDWLASKFDDEQCISCGEVPHKFNCYILRSLKLIENWAK